MNAPVDDGSLCDACRVPGRCCSGFVLNAEALFEAETPLHALVWAATVLTLASDGAPMLGLPFVPLMRAHGTWRLWCIWLSEDGRCTNYEGRPSLCRDYQPGQDPLCCEHVPRVPGPEAPAGG